ncbi:MAG TPA: hypothetical protein VFA12_13535 [Stellaceae bacterium]|nr:hypothetical protein [Stellaceae bacterium]
MSANKSSKQPKGGSPDALIRTSNKNKIELDEKELDKAVGGASDFQFTQKTDKASPTL